MNERMQTATGISSGRIREMRISKNTVDPSRPYAWLVEKERTHKGKVEDTAVIFLTNRECPFQCLMCDLWKNTLDFTVAPGLIPAQIEMALKEVGHAKHVKLYNSGSFFDPHAIPVRDYKSIASLLSGFETVIVESHPRFINSRVTDFRHMLKPDLHVAMGLEIADDQMLRLLNKQMTREDFKNATAFLTANGILSRAFILLRPPYLTEKEGTARAEKSIQFAFDSGVECCTVIPVRGGNGIMEMLKENGHYDPPSLRSLEEVLSYGIGMKKGRVFADTWDLQMFSGCNSCLEDRTNRIHQMNLSQVVLNEIDCSVCG